MSANPKEKTETFSFPSRQDDGFVAQYINRRLSWKITRILAKTRITPNTITFLSFALCLIGAILFGLGRYQEILLAGLLIQFASIIDGCDGEIARLKSQCTQFGAWFDTILDRYADVFIGIGITYGYWSLHHHWAIWPVASLAVIGFILPSYTKKEFILRYQRKASDGFFSKLIKRDMRLFALMLASLFNCPFEMMIVIGFVSHVGVAWMIYAVYRGERIAQNSDIPVSGTEQSHGEIEESREYLKGQVDAVQEC